MKITLPIVIYELIGDMAGDMIYKLVFRMTKKRKELSQVRIECRTGSWNAGQSYPLHAHNWKLGCEPCLEVDVNHFDNYYLERQGSALLRREHVWWNIRMKEHNLLIERNITVNM